jgi:hypothetical protein
MIASAASAVAGAAWDEGIAICSPSTTARACASSASTARKDVLRRLLPRVLGMRATTSSSSAAKERIIGCVVVVAAAAAAARASSALSSTATAARSGHVRDCCVGCGHAPGKTTRTVVKG